MDNKKQPFLILFFCLALILGNIYVIGFSSTKKKLIVIGGEEREVGVYSYIRPLSLLNLITPKNNEIESIFEIYFSQNSRRFGENKGEFLCNVSVYFYDESVKKIAEYYFKGIILQANTKLTGILWIEKEKYKRIKSIYYEVSESEHYKIFNNLYYKDILNIRGQDKELKEQERLLRKRKKQVERISPHFKKFGIMGQNEQLQTETEKGNKGYLLKMK